MISVTQALRPFVDFSKIPDHVLEAAAQRGTETHRLCSTYARGLPIIGAIAPECSGYFLSFQQWFDLSVEKVHLVEAHLEDPVYLFCGHPDLICTLRGDPGPTLIDLKTPITEAPTWRGQLSAYDRLAEVNNCPVIRCGSLQLKRDGNPAKFREYKRDGRDFAAFLNALTAYRYFTLNGRRHP